MFLHTDAIRSSVIALSIAACAAPGGSIPGDDDDACPLAAAAPAPARRFWSPLPPAGPGLGALLPPPPPAQPLVPLVTRRAYARAAAIEPATVEMRLLVLTAVGDEASFEAAAGALERIGVPFDVITTVDQRVGAADLWAGAACRYSGIILAHSELGYEISPGQWASALDEDEWALLDEYELACGARELAWYAWPAEHNGLDVVAELEAEEPFPALLTAAGAERFPYLRADVALEVAGASGVGAVVLDAAATTPLLLSDAGDVLAAVHVRPDGREVLSLTIATSPWTRHGLLLEAGLVEWVSRGLYLGARRVYLSPHIDDVFMASVQWGEPTATYRMTAGDVAALDAWHDDLAERLPPGSEVITQMAFNGGGSKPDELTAALRATQERFGWLNHTWAHQNMNAMSAAQAEAAVADNCQLADVWNIAAFSCTDLVTPEISGLDGRSPLEGMHAAGVVNAVSDTSVTEVENPGNPGDNPSHNVGRPNPYYPDIYQVPRRPTNIFFDVSTPEQERNEFNYLFRSELGRDLTYREIIEMDAEVGLQYLLTYDVDPLMFHQANVRDYGGGSLFTDWMDEVIARYTAQVTLPVLTLSLNDIAAVMRARAAYDACGVRAVRVTDADGARLELTATGSCAVPITGLDAPDAGTVEYYGGVPTTHVPVDACSSVSIRLPDTR